MSRQATPPAPGPWGSSRRRVPPIPDTSPLMSEMNTGTPAFESCPASSWSVLVLPVPVAPAISPWRFVIDNASWTRASLNSSPSSIGLPITRDGSDSA